MAFCVIASFCCAEPLVVLDRSIYMLLKIAYSNELEFCDFPALTTILGINKFL